MKLSKAKKQVKDFISKELKTLIVSIFAASFGAVLTIALYPSQKEIDQRYWLKQQEIISRQNNITNKIKFLDDYVDTITTYRLCALKTNANIMGDIYNPNNSDCYSQYSYKSLIKTLEAGFYFDINEFETIASLSANTWDYDDILSYLSQNPEDVPALLGEKYLENDELLQSTIAEIIKNINKDISDLRNITNEK